MIYVIKNKAAEEGGTKINTINSNKKQKKIKAVIR